MARKLKHNRTSYNLDAGIGTVPCGSVQGSTQRYTRAKRFTPQDVEYSVLRALTPALLAREAGLLTD
jgi:hypothetical protein